MILVLIGLWFSSKLSKAYHCIIALAVLFLMAVDSPARAQNIGVSGRWTLSAPATDSRDASRAMTGTTSERGRAMGAVQEVAAPSWYIDNLERSRNAVSGRLILVGASFMNVGRFFVSIDPNGTFVGTLLNSTGSRVADVNGAVSLTGVKGAFRAENGETGTFAWAPRHPAFSSVVQNVLQKKEAE